MLNEPRPGDTEGEGEGAEGQGPPQPNYIQVTPQEKEAIERVSYHSVFSPIELIFSGKFSNLLHDQMG